MEQKFKIGDKVYIVMSMFYLTEGTHPILEVEIAKTIIETSEDGITEIKYEVEFGTFDWNQIYEQERIYSSIQDAADKFRQVMNKDILDIDKKLKKYKKVLNDFKANLLSGKDEH